MMQIHERIKNQRLKSGLSEDQVADKIGIKRTTYQYWEKKTPGVDKIKLVAKALGLPEDYFFIENDENSGITESSIDEKIISAKPVDYLAEAFKLLKEQNDYLRRMLDINLASLSTDLNNNAAAIRAEIRGYAQRQILKEVNYNDEEFLTAKAEADKIYLLNLKTLLDHNKADVGI